MSHRRSFLFATLTATLVAQDFGPVVQAVAEAFPGKSHFGVVCNYRYSAKAVAQLQKALPEGAKLTVVDVQNYRDLIPAATTIQRRGIQLLALLPKDSMVFDGSAHATDLVDRVEIEIPAFGTTPDAIRSGCLMAMGQATDWKLLLNPKSIENNLKGTVGPIEVVRITTR